MRKRRFGRLAALVMALACLAMLLCGASFDIPSDSWVMDDANILSAQTEQYVNERTKVLSDACGAQIGVATVEYTGSLSVEDYAYQLANEWGLGDSKKNNGVLLLLVPPIVGVMSTTAEAVDGTVAYLTICFLGIPFITAYNIISSIFRGMGDSKSPMYFIAIACVANIALDYLFIGALGFGPAGAALGTTLAQTISVAVSLFMILRRKSISLSKGDFHPRRSVVGQILQIGVPVALQDGLIQIAFIVITIIANRRGLNDAAAVGIVEKIIGFVFLVPSSMLSTVSALGAQNIGAGKPERAVQTLRYAICITVGFGLCVCIGVQLCAEQLVALFTDRQAAGGAEVIRFGGQYLRSYILDCVFAGIHFSFSGYFCACGKSVLSFLHNISSVLLVRVPGSYLASMLFPDTLFPMGLASAGGSLLSVMLCILFYLKFCREKNPTADSA